MRDSFNEINITPLTDIFLVLLIIMMVIAPLLDQQGLNLAVPEMVTQEQHNKKDAKIMEFTVTSDNRYLNGDNEVSAKDLEKLIASSVKEFKDGLAAVKKDGKWGYIDESGELVVPCKNFSLLISPIEGFLSSTPSSFIENINEIL